VILKRTKLLFNLSCLRRYRHRQSSLCISVIFIQVIVNLLRWGVRHNKPSMLNCSIKGAVLQSEQASNIESGKNESQTAKSEEILKRYVSFDSKKEASLILNCCSVAFSMDQYAQAVKSGGRIGTLLAAPMTHRSLTFRSSDSKRHVEPNPHRFHGTGVDSRLAHNRAHGGRSHTLDTIPTGSGLSGIFSVSGGSADNLSIGGSSLGSGSIGSISHVSPLIRTQGNRVDKSELEDRIRVSPFL
jgi:hypothetical protein